MAQLKIKLVKSLIGSKKDQIATAQALGLKRIGDCTTQPDNPSFTEPNLPITIHKLKARWLKSSTSST